MCVEIRTFWIHVVGNLILEKTRLEISLNSFLQLVVLP